MALMGESSTFFDFSRFYADDVLGAVIRSPFALDLGRMSQDLIGSSSGN
jgi:hypothetical protein